MAKQKVEVDTLIKQLEAAGYEVRRRVPSKRHTFEIEVPVLEEFYHVLRDYKIKVRDAINEALSDWIVSKRAQASTDASPNQSDLPSSIIEQGETE